MLTRYTWFDAPDGRPTVFAHGKPSPIDKGYIVIAMFAREEKIHVFLLWTATGNGGDESPHPPMRYALETTVKTYGAFSMPLAVWQKKLADELVLADDDSGTAQEERDDVLAYLEALALEQDAVNATVAGTLRQAAEDIEAGAHTGEDEDDSDEEAETPPDGVSAGAPPQEAAPEAPAAS
jgi:hypothetical protein